MFGLGKQLIGVTEIINKPSSYLSKPLLAFKGRDACVLHLHFSRFVIWWIYGFKNSTVSSYIQTSVGRQRTSYEMKKKN